MRTLLLSLSLAAALVALPSAAAAHTIQHDIEAAQAYWQSGVCAGQWQVTPDAAEQAGHRGGAATGIAFTYNPTSGSYADERGRWDWHVERCEFTVDRTLQGCEREAVIRHEIGHFVHGPGHDGPLAEAALLPVLRACQNREHEQQQAARRSEAQTARAQVIRRVRSRLPSGAWRIACTPLRPAMRCRATMARSVRRFSIRRTQSTTLVRLLAR